FNQAPAEQAAAPVMEELRAPVVELRPEDKKTGMFSPMDQAGQFAGSAPPPLWGEGKSKIERQERGRRRPLIFIAVAVMVAALLATAGWLYVSGRLAGVLGQKPPPPPKKIEQPHEPAKKVEEPTKPEPKAAVAEVGPCGENAVLLDGKKVCIDA